MKISWKARTFMVMFAMLVSLGGIARAAAQDDAILSRMVDVDGVRAKIPWPVSARR